MIAILTTHLRPLASISNYSNQNKKIACAKLRIKSKPIIMNGACAAGCQNPNQIWWTAHARPDVKIQTKCKMFEGACAAFCLMLSCAVLKDVRWLSACTNQAEDISGSQSTKLCRYFWTGSQCCQLFSRYFGQTSQQILPLRKKIINAFIREN